MSVYRVILLQHRTPFIQPIYHTIFCGFFEAIRISYNYCYDLITGCHSEMCVWVSFLTVFTNICKKLVIMLRLGFKTDYAKFLALKTLPFFLGAFLSR